jgi:HTH-type transcriptional regulator/antitoxin HipB
MNPTEIAKSIRQRRIDLGLTQLELADLAEVSERLIRDLEKGRLSVRIDKLLALLKVLGLEILIEKSYIRGKR